MSDAVQPTEGGEPEGTTPEPTGGEPTNHGADTGGESLGWRAALSPELQNDERFTSFKGPNDLAKQYIEAQERLNNAIVKPGENASEEELASYRKSIGVPETADAYELQTDVEIPGDGTDSFNQWFKETAHKMNLPKEQAEQFYKELMNRAGEEAAEGQRIVQTTKEEAENQLRDMWGEEFDHRIERARKFAALGGDEFLQLLEETGLTNHPGMASVLDRFADLISEDTLAYGKSRPSGNPTGNPGRLIFANTPGMDK